MDIHVCLQFPGVRVALLALLLAHACLRSGRALDTLAQGHGEQVCWGVSPPLLSPPALPSERVLALPLRVRFPCPAHTPSEGKETVGKKFPGESKTIEK